MKKLLVISSTIIFLFLFYKCSKEENSMESLKSEFNLKEANGTNIPIPKNAISIEEARLYLSGFGLFSSENDMQPSKLKSGTTESAKKDSVVKGTTPKMAILLLAQHHQVWELNILLQLILLLSLLFRLIFLVFQSLQ